MMRNKKVTDYEINKAVAKYLKLNTIAYDRTGIVLFDDMDATPFDPCNNPADAMPIVIENGIAIHPYKTSSPSAFDAEIGEFHGHAVFNKNIYRAAMEVFLMMKDAENAGKQS